MLRPTMTVNDVYDYIAENQFEALETPELDTLFYDFVERYIDTELDANKARAIKDLFDQVVFGYNRQGFLAGYTAAHKLIFDVAR